MTQNIELFDPADAKTISEKETIARVHAMCIESLCPETFKKWDVIRTAFISEESLIKQLDIRCKCHLSPEDYVLWKAVEAELRCVRCKLS